MKTILLMRHAKSSWDFATLSDHQRPLNERGLRDLPVIASGLAAQELVPEWCLASTANRAASTARGLRESGLLDFPLELTDELYHASPVEIIEVLRKLPDEIQSCLIVAHNPGLEELVCHWSEQNFRPFPTGAVAVFDFESLVAWKELQYHQKPQERFFQIPKEIS